MNGLITSTLLAEYKIRLANLGREPTDEGIAEALVRESEWSEDGAYTIISLAREYGTSILRNALALADALGVEDGTSGL